jgi:hypothetical protein
MVSDRRARDELDEVFEPAMVLRQQRGGGHDHADLAIFAPRDIELGLRFLDWVWPLRAGSLNGNNFLTFSNSAHW